MRTKSYALLSCFHKDQECQKEVDSENLLGATGLLTEETEKVEGEKEREFYQSCDIGFR